MINKNFLIENLNILGDKIGYIKLLSVDGNENTIAEDARTSTGNKQKTEVENKKLVLRLAKDNHTSPLEMASMKFEVKLPIFVARQWMRHRMGHYNEVSGRYKQSECEFYLPTTFYQQHKNNMQCSSEEKIDNNEEAIKIAQESFNNSKKIYQELINKGVSREQARLVLPTSTYTTMRFKMDLNNLQKFLKLRMANDAQREIRLYANEIFNMMKNFFPTLADNFKKQNYHLFYETGYILKKLHSGETIILQCYKKDNKLHSIDGLNVITQNNNDCFSKSKQELILIKDLTNKI